MSEQSQDYSDHIAKEIDAEINALIQEAYQGATKILKKHKNALVEISKILLVDEVIDGPKFVELIQAYDSGKVNRVSVKASVDNSQPKASSTKPDQATDDDDNAEASPANKKKSAPSLDKPIDQVT
jgi:cell division protease FtsH